MARKLKEPTGCDERPDAAAIIRFFRFIDFKGPEPEDKSMGRCWLWTGYRCEKGYGQFKWRGRAWWAYQVAYLIFNGVLVAGRHRAHRCHNPACVNPDHVQQQTPAENVAERNRRIAARRRSQRAA